MCSVVLVVALVPGGRVVDGEVGVVLAGLMCFGPGCSARVAVAACCSVCAFVVLVVGLADVLPGGRVVSGGLEVVEPPDCGGGCGASGGRRGCSAPLKVSEGLSPLLAVEPWRVQAGSGRMCPLRESGGIELAEIG